jgi:hypothetical protein
MNFTPKSNVVPIVCGILIITAAGWNEAVNRSGSAPVVTNAVQEASATPTLFQTNGNVAIIPAVERIPSANIQKAQAQTFLPVVWYKNKHWWKRNAPIIGGAAGGGLIGGLAGGGKGLIIGGAAGAGGGYLYKHYKGHSHHHNSEYRRGGQGRSVQTGR